MKLIKVVNLKKIKKIRKIPKCKLCGEDMTLKHGKFGDFFGCSTFPKCKFSMPAYFYGTKLVSPKIPIWKMQNGQNIILKDMSIDHLKHAIDLIISTAGVIREKIFFDTYSALSTVHGDMAQYYIEGELWRVERMSDEELMRETNPFMELMEKELIKRGVF